MLKHSIYLTAAIALSSLALAACGSSSSDNSSDSAYSPPAESSNASPTGGQKAGSGEKIMISADPGGALAFTKPELTATAGHDTVEFTNASTTAHNVEIEDAAGNEVATTDTITGSTTSTTADLKPGKYTFYCTIPGHREAGMEGTLTVK